MSSLTTFVDCPAIQSDLERVFCTGSPEPVPLLEWLFSPQNNADVLNQLVSPGGGKIRSVMLTYFRRILESEVNDYVDYACTASNKRGETSTTFDLDIHEGSQISKAISILDLVERCQSNEDYRAKFFRDLVDGLKRQMETAAAVKLVALAGAFSTKDRDPDGTAIASSTKQVKTLVSAANPTQHYNAHEAIRQTARLNNYCSAPVVTGEYEIVNYYERNGMAGCCADIGIDFGRYINGGKPIVLPSYRIPQAFGDDNKFLTMSAGAALPIYFNLYDGDVNALNDDSNFAGIIVDPQTGIPFDLRVQRICNDWHFNLSLAWDLRAAPEDMFENSDPLDGNRFIHKHQVVNS